MLRLGSPTPTHRSDQVTWLIPYFAAGMIGYAPAYPKRSVAATIALACLAYPFLALVVLTYGKQHAPVIYDATLTALDGRIGHTLIAAAEHLLRANAVLRIVAHWVYDWNLPLAMGAVWLRWRVLRDMRLPIALLGVAALGLVGYAIVPAVGPRAYWPTFPTPSVALGTIDEFRNAMPSVHFAVTLLAAAGVWTVPRTAGIAFVVVTGLATLGFGQHYVIDLVVAVPFAAAVWTAVNRRVCEAVASACVSFAALLAIRFTG